jgi:hypothetical protein
MSTCPNCRSDRTRRGGYAIWSVYLILVALAIPAVVHFRLNAALVGGVMLAVIVLSHLTLDERVCLDCGTQWRRNGG